ncbi:hypothetical protein ABZ635_16715 [Nocardiopsis sp. NPDC007018]|uniref:hypothetical protein n=1 Tax=Nocardiopsis sp. NPDC007018 TaxID=3155721 RepID=UPI0033E6B4D1
MNVDWELVVAITAAVIALASGVISGFSLYFACRSTNASEQSASAADRSATTAEEATGVAKESAGIAKESAGSAKISAEAAQRSASADELATRLAKGLSRTCHVRWEVKNRGAVWRRFADDSYEPTDEGSVKVKNTGEEVALNVTLKGESIREHEPAEKIQPGESHDFPYFYDVELPDETKELVIEWDRPEEFGDERMSVSRYF